MHRINRIKKSHKKYDELHELWLETELYLSNNRYALILKINKTFYKYLKKHEFNNTWDCWSICEKYITSKQYRPNIVFDDFIIIKHEEVWGLKRKGTNKLIAISNTQKEIRNIIKSNYINESY